MTPRAKALAAALRQVRERTGIPGRQIAYRLGISHAAISHWETGRRIPRLEDVASLLTVLDVIGEERERILELARRAADRDWLTVGIPGVSQAMAGAIECERTANFITEWSPWVVPGLLQTSEYARAVLGAGELPPGDVEARLMVRLGRRDALTRRDLDGLAILLGEPAIRQVIGGRAVMAEQLRQLLRSAASGIELRVVPIGEGWHPGIAGPFVLYQFKDSPSIVHLEHHRSSAFIFDDNDVAGYEAAVTTVRDAALNPTRSAVLINKIIAGLEAA